MYDLKLGEKVRSKVGGFRGTVTAICHYLYGEDSIEVTADDTVNGEVKSMWRSPASLEKDE